MDIILEELRFFSGRNGAFSSLSSYLSCSCSAVLGSRTASKNFVFFNLDRERIAGDSFLDNRAIVGA